jgi:hypothetical protein
MTGRARTRRRLRILTLPLIIVLVLTACGGLEPSITLAQAVALVNQHLRDLTATLPGARLEPHGPGSIDPCNDPIDGGPFGRVSVGQDFWVRDIPKSRNPAIFDLAVRYWTDHGFRILNDDRLQGDNFVNAHAPAPDPTGMAIQESVDESHTLSIVAASDCVWPNGTPDPKPRRCNWSTPAWRCE